MQREMDLYSKMEYNELKRQYENEMLRNPETREKYMREKKERESIEKKVRQIEHRIEIMY